MLPNLHHSLSRPENSQMSNDLSNANLVSTRQSLYCLAVALEMDYTQPSKSIGSGQKARAAVTTIARCQQRFGFRKQAKTALGLGEEYAQ